MLAPFAPDAGRDGGREGCFGGVRGVVKVKLEFMAECDAQQAAYYLDDRGYDVRLLGKALIIDGPDQADLALVQVTYRAYAVDIVDGDIS